MVASPPRSHSQFGRSSVDALSWLCWKQRRTAGSVKVGSTLSQSSIHATCGIASPAIAFEKLTPTEASSRDHSLHSHGSVRQSGRVPCTLAPFWPGSRDARSVPGPCMQTAHSPAECRLEASASASWGVSWGFLLTRDPMVVSSGWGSRSIMPQQTLDMHFRGRSDHNLGTRKRIQPPVSQDYCVRSTQNAHILGHRVQRRHRVLEEAPPLCRQPGFASSSASGFG